MCFYVIWLLRVVSFRGSKRQRRLRHAAVFFTVLVQYSLERAVAAVED